LVEKLSNATTGSVPSTARVLAALAIAISASWTGVGSTTTAQSAKAISPLCPWEASWRAIKNTLETRRTRGPGPMQCSAARTVSAVVLAAPPTLPSASPALTINAAK
jgi:hypothetical protein